MNHITAIFLSCLIMALIGINSTAYSADEITLENGAVIFSYQRIGEDQYPDTNIRIDQFNNHIEELRLGNYNIVSLQDIVDAFKNKTTLPPRSIAITFDGGYRSVFEHAMPLLKKSGIPYTVFLPIRSVHLRAPQYLTVKQIQTMKKSKLADFGLHSADYTRTTPETRLAQINTAKALFRDILGSEPSLFAYPFGEYDLNYLKLIKKQHFKAAVAMHSSPVQASSDIFALPRFVMTESHADIDRFRLLANTTPLNISKITPLSPVLEQETLQLTLQKPLTNPKNLSCFVSGAGQVDIEIKEENITVPIDTSINARRLRLNCTYSTTKDAQTHWQWFGRLFIQPDQTY